MLDDPAPTHPHQSCPAAPHQGRAPPANRAPAPRPTKITVIRPPTRRGLSIQHVQAREARAGILVLEDSIEQRLLGQFRRRQVAQMLVDPVRHERGRDPLVPPGQQHASPPPRLARCSSRRSPRDRRRSSSRAHGEQPANVRIGPRLAKQPGVLLEVSHLLARGLTDVPTFTNEGSRFRRNLVDVDLVTEKQETIGPLESPPAVDANTPRAHQHPNPADHRTARAYMEAPRVHRLDTTQRPAEPDARLPSFESSSLGARPRAAKPFVPANAPHTD